MTSLAYDVIFGAINTRVVIEIDSDIFDAAPTDRDALFEFVDNIKGLVPATPAKAKPERSYIEPKAFVKRKASGRTTAHDCDRCEKSFGTAQGLRVHTYRAHSGNNWSVKGGPLKAVAVDGPKLAPITEPTPPPTRTHRPHRSRRSTHPRRRLRIPEQRCEHPRIEALT